MATHKTRKIWPRLDRLLILTLMACALGWAGWWWLKDNPQDNPFSPLDLRHERGWATPAKLTALGDKENCHAVLERSQVSFTSLPQVGEGACLRDDRLTLDAIPMSPARPQMTCQVAAGLVLWVEQDVQQIAQDVLGSQVARIEQLGTYNCRRISGASEGSWSEHATGNAIDIAGFVLEDGRRISLLDHWNTGDERSQFLKQLRDAACASFGTVLSPDYNAAHADHFHLDQARSPVISYCR